MKTFRLFFILFQDPEGCCGFVTRFVNHGSPIYAEGNDLTRAKFFYSYDDALDFIVERKRDGFRYRIGNYNLLCPDIAQSFS